MAHQRSRKQQQISKKGCLKQRRELEARRMMIAGAKLMTLIMPLKKRIALARMPLHGWALIDAMRFLKLSLLERGASMALGSIKADGLQRDHQWHRGHRSRAAEALRLQIARSWRVIALMRIIATMMKLRS